MGRLHGVVDRVVRAAVAVMLVALMAGCADDAISVDAVEPPESIPPRDAVLVEGGWEEAAAWIRRENADGRPVVVNILASWCGPCERELPLLLDAYETRSDIAFLGIDHLDERGNAERFVEEHDIQFPTIFDITGEVAYAVGGRGMPTTVIFDVDGRMIAHHTGELTPRSLQELLELAI